ncbi:MAG: hypothetical protein IPN75_17020 [Dechloromonas sp.]|uniref:Uncharacterized protein n=1 Tax=Candidatus Dechloromonas phosphorivorans TaxID=2899244 RepID=A0A9D7LTI1_9RHOO|nr:hypothetical protein [Candidatus Dechloromonas phosphorivorans]
MWTLLDSAGAIVQAIQAACRHWLSPAERRDQARHVIGLGLADDSYAAPDLPPERYEAMVDRYRFHYLGADHRLVLFAESRKCWPI